MANAGDNPVEEIRQGALFEAKGDTTAAFLLLSVRTADLLDVTNVTQADLELCKRANERFKEYYGYETKSWIERTWDSDIVKVGIFIGGIWLGARIADNVN